MASVEEAANRTCQRQEAGPSNLHIGHAPLPKDKWKEKMSNKKGKRKEDTTKRKGKAPAHKLQSHIKRSMYMTGILEERTLDEKIEFTLRTALGIAKKDFHQLIIGVIKRKRKITTKTMMARPLDTRMTKDEEDGIGQVFAMMHDHTNTDTVRDEVIEDFVDDNTDEVMQNFLVVVWTK